MKSLDMDSKMRLMYYCRLKVSVKNFLNVPPD